jgi:hypothetical protein
MRELKYQNKTLHERVDILEGEIRELKESKRILKESERILKEWQLLSLLRDGIFIQMH